MSPGTAGKTDRTTTKPTTTTTTKEYPVMTVNQPVAIVDLMKPTFEIVSSNLNLRVTQISLSLIASATVTYELNVTSKTDKIQLRCAVNDITGLTLISPDGKQQNLNDKQDKESKVFTINLPTPINAGIYSIKITYMPSLALERLNIPCEPQECFILFNRQLSLLVPHFDYKTKIKWSIEVDFPADVHFLTDSKANTTGTISKYHETASPSLSELTFIIVDKFIKHASGKQVETYLSKQSKVEDVTDLVTTMEQALASKSKPSIPPDETFMIVVLPAIENYQFLSRNIVLVGVNLLMANREIKMNFVWRWIYRTILYRKVSPTDKNPNWIYEQSAFFLSINTKSNHTELWKKHLLGSAMERGHNSMKGGSNQLSSHPDEDRFFEKEEQIAKISTILAMITSLGSSVSGDLLAILDNARDNSLSAYFFFLKSILDLGNGEKLDVDRVVSCYIHSPTAPRIHFTRISPSQVVVQRSSVGEKEKCDFQLWYIKGSTNNNMGKNHILLSATEEKIQVEADSPILLSGISPFSAYGYTMDQTEFDRLLDEKVLASFDDFSLSLLAFNAFRAAAEGKLNYKSLHRLMRMLLLRKAISMDEVVDLWMWTIDLSRNDTLRQFIKPIVASVLNITGSASDASKVEDYFCERFDKSVKDAPPFEIEKALKLVKISRVSCYRLPMIIDDSISGVDCVTGSKQCSYDPIILEFDASIKIVSEETIYHGKFNDAYVKCTGKPCLMPILRGLLMTSDEQKLQNWLTQTTTLGTDMISRQVVKGIFKGLAFNSLSKPLLFPYLIENWHLMHEKYFMFPAFLGDIVDTLASTITTNDQLVELKQFVSYHGQKLDTYRDFDDQILKAAMVVEWNSKRSEEFSRLFD